MSPSGPRPPAVQPRLDDASLPGYLVGAGLLPDASGARVSAAGEGNLNYVRRVEHSGRSWIVKQARPGVEGFPELPLSADRILFERRYDEAVRALLPPDQVILPAIARFDERARVLVLEDLGTVTSLQDALRAGEVPLDALRALGVYLARVHATSASRLAQLAPRFENIEMRRLHGEALFDAPWAGDLPGVAAPLRARMHEAGREPALRARLAGLRTAYHTRGQALVHGDVKCANVLLAPGGARLIDAEFAHLGDPAFDLGAALAHVQLCLAPQTGEQVRARARGALVTAYTSVVSPGDALLQRALGYCGVDMAAHLVGPSRLPFLSEPERAMPLLHRGLALLRDPA